MSESNWVLVTSAKLPKNYKTVLCDRYESGTCPYGKSCNFAHGVYDLKQPPTSMTHACLLCGRQCCISCVYERP